MNAFPGIDNPITGPEQKKASEDPNGLSILLIEEDQFLSDGIVDILRIAGVKNVIATTGLNDGLTVFLDDNMKFQLVIIDLGLEVSNRAEIEEKAFGLIELISDQSPESEVILMSSYRLPLSIKEIVASGKARFIRKAFEPEQLIDAVHAVINAPDTK